jgi:hypothetical protein
MHDNGQPARQRHDPPLVKEAYRNRSNGHIDSAESGFDTAT